MADVMARGHGGDGREDPPHPGGQPPGQHEQDVVLPRRKGRGKSKNLNLEREWKKNGRKPLRLEFDLTTCTPVGDVYDLLIADVAEHMTREIPLDKDSWKDVPDAEKNRLYTHLMTYFDIEGILEDPEKKKFKDGLDDVIRTRYAGRKAYAKRHFMKMGGYDDLRRVRATRPVGINEENWGKMITHFTSENHMKRSAQNKKNKAKQVLVYRGGRCSYSNACHKLNKSRLEAFGDAHRTKDGTFDSPIAEAQYNALLQEFRLQSQSSSSSSNPTPVDEVAVFEKVLGPRRGIIKGIGHKPSGTSASSGVYEWTPEASQPSQLDILLRNPEFRAAMAEVVQRFTSQNDMGAPNSDDMGASNGDDMGAPNHDDMEDEA